MTIFMAHVLLQDSSQFILDFLQLVAAIVAECKVIQSSELPPKPSEIIANAAIVNNAQVRFT